MKIKRKKPMIFSSLLTLALVFGACGASGKGNVSDTAGTVAADAEITRPSFDADSAYSYVKRQVDFGLK